MPSEIPGWDDDDDHNDLDDDVADHEYVDQAYLLNIPGWDWRRDDQAVCLNEVKYGLLAQVLKTFQDYQILFVLYHCICLSQSCLAPGFFTMACNIVTSSHKVTIYGMRSLKKVKTWR